MENTYEKSTNIFNAIDNNDCVYIKNYFDLGNDINITNTRDENLLHRAARKGSFETFSMLINYGVKVNALNKYKETPLHVAVQFNKIEFVELLLFKNANIDVFDIKKRTPLHIACFRGYFDIITLLLKKGSKIHTPDEIGARPIHYAVRSGKINIIKLIIEAGASLIDIDYRKNNVLHYACMEGHDSLIPFLMDKFPFSDTKNIYEETPLHYAAKFCKKETVEFLLEKNHYIYAKDIDGLTPMDIKELDVENKYFLEDYIENFNYRLKEQDKIHLAIRNKDFELVKKISNFDPNSTDAYGNKCLYYAILNNDYKMVDLLLTNKANLKNLDKYGHSALLISFIAGNSRIILKILEHKVDINEVYYNRSFLYTAIIRNDFLVVKSLLDNKISKDFVDDKGRDLKEIALEYANDKIYKLL